MLTPAGTSLESNRFHQWFSTNLSSDVYKFRFFSRTFILMHPGLGDGGVYHAYCYVWSLSVTRVLFLFLFFIYRQGRGQRQHACDFVWLHHALGLLEHHPEEEPQPALPDGLWLQGKAAEGRLRMCSLSRGVEKKKTAIHFFHYTSRHSRANKTRHDSGE